MSKLLEKVSISCRQKPIGSLRLSAGPLKVKGQGSLTMTSPAGLVGPKTAMAEAALKGQLFSTTRKHRFPDFKMPVRKAVLDLEEIGVGRDGRAFRSEDGALVFKLFAPAKSWQLAPEFATARYFRAKPIINMPDVIGVSPKQGVIAYEFAPGEDLINLIQDKELAHAAAAKIVLEAAKALAEMAAHGWVHGDVNPKNIRILRGENGAIEKVTLFDLSRATFERKKPGENKTSDLRPIGCYDFVAPEEFLDGLITSKTDIYALGKTLYKCLTGKHLHNPPADNFLPVLYDEVTLRSITAEDPALQAVPIEFRSLLERMLSIDPAVRLSAAEVVVYLENYLNSHSEM